MASKVGGTPAIAHGQRKWACVLILPLLADHRLNVPCTASMPVSEQHRQSGQTTFTRPRWLSRNLVCLGAADGSTHPQLHSLPLKIGKGLCSTRNLCEKKHRGAWS